MAKRPHPRPWHKDSRFGSGPRVSLCREQRAVWKARLHLFRHARKLTPLHEDIGLALLKRLGRDGRLDPTHQTLAEDTGCSARSVQRALAALSACGLLRWVRRIVRDGWRVEQASNAYALMTGEPPAIRTLPRGGQNGGPTKSIDKSIDYTSVIPPTDAEIDAARAALARRRAVMEERWLRKAGRMTG